ncbi:MAG: NAD(P)-binding protein [Candidatus Hydrogenedens sp.]|nr:NAD(P)-binding protein [Candidatus Hydrogenedens sp.]
MLKRYAPMLSETTWDAVFIGSGIGSLTAAAVLAREGWKVLVLEKHYEPGGFCHTFKRKDFEWDVGVHYVGGVQHPKQFERQAFDYISGRRLDWAPMGAPYDRAIIDGQTYDFVPGSQEQLKLWISYFPQEEQAIREYWKRVRECAKSSQLYFADRAVPQIISSLGGGLMRRPFLKYADRTTYDVLRELTDNEALITMLCTQCGDYGLPPNQASFAIHAMVVSHYRDGGSYPIGGAGRIHQSVMETIEDHDGCLAVRCGVQGLLMERGRAAGVVLEGGEEIRAGRVVSGMGVRNTLARLVPEDQRRKFGADEALKTVKASIAHLCLYVGVDVSDEELGFPRFNYWCYDPYAGDGTPGGRLPSAYISFPSAKDPSWAEAHPGKATVQMIGLGRMEDFAEWEGTRWKKRGPKYEALKAKFETAMLERLYTMYPKTRNRIGWAEVSTPLSTAHFSHYPSGEIYGLEHTPERFRQRWLRPRTPIKGLYLTGQDICTAGVAGAMFSGLLTSSVLLGKNMISVIHQRETAQAAVG